MIINNKCLIFEVYHNTAYFDKGWVFLFCCNKTYIYRPENPYPVWKKTRGTKEQVLRHNRYSGCKKVNLEYLYSIFGKDIFGKDFSFLQMRL